MPPDACENDTPTDLRYSRFEPAWRATAGAWMSLCEATTLEASSATASASDLEKSIVERGE